MTYMSFLNLPPTSLYAKSIASISALALANILYKYKCELFKKEFTFMPRIKKSSAVLFLNVAFCYIFKIKSIGDNAQNNLNFASQGNRL